MIHIYIYILNMALFVIYLIFGFLYVMYRKTKNRKHRTFRGKTKRNKTNFLNVVLSSCFDQKPAGKLRRISSDFVGKPKKNVGKPKKMSEFVGFFFGFFHVECHFFGLTLYSLTEFCQMSAFYIH